MKKNNVVAYLLCLLFIVAGCTDDAEKIINNKENNRIHLFIPDAQEVQVYSTATERENYIEDCFVVTFSNGGTYKKSEKIDVSGIVKNGMAAAILPQLSFDIDLGDKVYVICNTGLATLPAGINTESDIDNKFKPAKDYYFGGEVLPMSGSIEWSTSLYTVTLTRAVAKVQIKLGEGFNIGGGAFEPSAYWRIENFKESQCGFVVGNYAGKSNILRNASALSQNVSGLSAFYGTTSEEKFIRFMQYAGSADSMTIYISEYPNSTKDCEGNTIADDVFNKKRHFLLMIDKVSNGSSLLGNGVVTSAWRLDFYDAASKKYFDIKRNHHYIFAVNKIRSAPYLYRVPGSPATISKTFSGDQEVWYNPGNNIEYTVYVQDSWVKGTYSNGQYAVSVSTDTIRDASVSFQLKVEVPSGVDISQTKTHILNVYNRLNQPIGSTGDDLEVVGFPTSGTSGINVPIDGSTLTLNFTVNDDQYLDSAYMIVRVGNIYKKIMIILSESWVYMPDAGFREYCIQKGFISKVRSSDNRYVKLSPAGEAATTITIQRNSVPFGTSCGTTVHLPSDVNTSLYTAVSDLTGLEAFKNLEYLYIGGNNITTINVSANTKLKVLSSYGTPITSANFSNNKELYLIFLSINTQINTLDISRCSPSMCFLAGKSNVLIMTTQQDTSIGGGYMGSFGTTTYVPSPY